MLKSDLENPQLTRLWAILNLKKMCGKDWFFTIICL